MFANCDPLDAKMYDVRTDDIQHLTKHFQLWEFQSRDGTYILLLHGALVALLDDLRTHLDRAVIVRSGFRTHAHNSDVDGAKKSKHLLGMAADITVKGTRPRRLRQIIQDRYDPGGLGLYDTFVHVDVWGSGRRWDNTASGA